LFNIQNSFFFALPLRAGRLPAWHRHGRPSFPAPPRLGGWATGGFPWGSRELPAGILGAAPWPWMLRGKPQPSRIFWWETAACRCSRPPGRSRNGAALEGGGLEGVPTATSSLKGSQTEQGGSGEGRGSPEQGKRVIRKPKIILELESNLHSPLSPGRGSCWWCRALGRGCWPTAFPSKLYSGTRQPWGEGRPASPFARSARGSRSRALLPGTAAMAPARSVSADAWRGRTELLGNCRPCVTGSSFHKRGCGSALTAL